MYSYVEAVEMAGESRALGVSIILSGSTPYWALLIIKCQGRRTSVLTFLDQ